MKKLLTIHLSGDIIQLRCEKNTTTREERSEKMSEREQKIIESISDALPKMSEFDKGYLLGSAERMVSEKEKIEKENKDKKAG